jgi:hypothetical protein
VTYRASPADRLALAIAEHGPASGSRLAVILGVRKQVVLRELWDARRFERVGRGSTSSWRLVGTDREPTDRVARVDPDPEVTRDLREMLDAILARLTRLEQRLDRLDPAPPANVDRPLDGQITVDEALAATTGEAMP